MINPPVGKIVLNKRADRRIRRGRLWVFSNEIAEPRVSELEPGALYELCDASGEFLGICYANPATLIAARLLSRKKVQIDRDFLRERVDRALQFRQRLFPDRGSYRIVFGEADYLPGLVVDKYEDYLCGQVLTAGMEELAPHIIEYLIEALRPEGVYLRNDGPSRELEGLPSENRLVYGTVPDRVEIRSGNLKILVSIPGGQKTGYFLDQESNRGPTVLYTTPDAEVLDLYCYSGAWGLRALAAGAQQATFVDSSRTALGMVQENADLNGLSDRIDIVKDTAIDFLKKADRTWDMVFVDPPAFVKSRSRLKEGKKGYIDVNRRAMMRIASGGILVTCSCSHHLDWSAFEEIITSAAVQSGRALRILDMRGQGPDHPILLSMPETRYLKVFIAEVL